MAYRSLYVTLFTFDETFFFFAALEPRPPGIRATAGHRYRDGRHNASCMHPSTYTERPMRTSDGLSSAQEGC